MRKLKMLALSIMTFVLATPATFADHRGKGNHATLEDCLQVVKKIKQGMFTRAEFHVYSHEGMPAYEIELTDDSGRHWEFECNTKGNLVEIEQEVEKGSDPLFKGRARVSESDARKTATALYPGKVEKVQYEIEFDGEPVYEFNIEDKDGAEFNVEVSAESGDIIEVSVEAWEIGS